MDYSARDLALIEVKEFQFSREPEDTISGRVSFDLSGKSHDEIGPNVTVGLALVFDPKSSIQDAERALIAAAVAVLKRIADLSPVPA